MPRTAKKTVDFELVKDHLFAILCAKNLPHHLRHGVNLALFILDFLKQGLPAPDSEQRAAFIKEKIEYLDPKLKEPEKPISALQAKRLGELITKLFAIETLPMEIRREITTWVDYLKFCSPLRNNREPDYFFNVLLAYSNKMAQNQPSAQRVASQPVAPTIEEPIDVRFPENSRIKRIWSLYDRPQFGFKANDLLAYDLAIKPVAGDAAIYAKKEGGDNVFLIQAYAESPETKGYKYLGMVTHVMRCVYNQGDKILNAEIVTSMEEKKVKMTHHFDSD